MSDEFFEGNDKVQTFKYEEPGTRLGGKVIEVGEARQAKELIYNNKTRQYEMGDLKTWDDGTPIMQKRVVVQTQMRDHDEDDGRRCWWFEQGREITRSMMAAVKAVRGKSMPEVGSELYGTFTARDPESFEGKKKLYSFEYRAPFDGPADDPWGGMNAQPAPSHTTTENRFPPPQQGGWGTPPPPAPAAPAPATSPGAQWGQAPAPTPAPPPPAAPAPSAEPDPAMLAYFTSKGIEADLVRLLVRNNVTLTPDMTEATMRSIAAYVK